MAALVIIGSGLAGYTLAREFRKRDRGTEVTLVTADGGEMYAKPMLSNAFQQNKALDQLATKTAGELAGEIGITVLARTRVLSLDRGARVLTTDKGKIAYGRLVLAVGADPRPYGVPGSEKKPIATVNDLDSYRAWRHALVSGKRVLLVGAGLIGSEFANDLAIAGYDVTLIDPSPWPLGRLLPEPLGHEMARRLTDAGIRVACGRSLSRIDMRDYGGTVAILDDGQEIAFDHALSAIGLVPRTGLAKAAGLAVNRGIVVDRLLATSDPTIHALGDCAETEIGPLSFVLPLMAEAKALAATLAGQPTPLVLPAMPVVVKTPALPLAVCPPPAGAEGEWRIEGAAPDLTALFLDRNEVALGFVLSGTAVNERQKLGKTMPPVLAPQAEPAAAVL